MTTANAITDSQGHAMWGGFSLDSLSVDDTVTNSFNYTARINYRENKWAKQRLVAISRELPGMDLLVNFVQNDGVPLHKIARFNISSAVKIIQIDDTEYVLNKSKLLKRKIPIKR